MLWILHKTNCRKVLLAYAERKWPGKFTRVRQEVYEHLERELRNSIEIFIAEHPTLGKTLSMSTHHRVKKEKDS